jgi:capsule polysaccharide export protein KpsE/RkpR
MWPFQEKLEPAFEPQVDREAEAHTRVRALKADLDALETEMLGFKQKYSIKSDRFGRLLGMLCADINGRPAIETEWRVLLKRRDSLVAQWHAALFSWSEAKAEAEKQKGVLA